MVSKSTGQCPVRRGFACPARTTGSGARFSRAHRAGFTLIEIMVVAAIMLMIVGTGVPIVYNAWHKRPLIRALNDTLEVLNTARARSILQGVPVDVVFHPGDRRLEVSGGAAGGGGGGAAPSSAISVQGAIPGASGAVGSAQYGDTVAIEMLDINLAEYNQAEEGRVRFYPDGRCDELIMILRSLENGDQFGISLEITTGLASILNATDLQALRK
jgi:prepilin-type N-terminal cleavage/methylation domain-containing protein